VRGSFYVATAHADSGEPIWHDQIGFALLHAIEQGKAERAGAILGQALRPDSVAACIEATKTLSPAERVEQVAQLSALTTGGVPDWAALMDWSDARVLQRAGNEIGSHSLSHPLLPQCDDAWLERELHESKVRIESELGTQVETFCYPNGDADGRVARAAERAGYACAVTTTWGMNDDSVDPFLLRRCDINAEHVVDRTGQLSAARLQLRLSGLQPGL
jgi:peptidoglycan/xylan/chitin deacetylase (PgdA/CDA1 family)